VFDIQAVVVDALERAVAKVSGELAAVETGEPVQLPGTAAGGGAPTARRRRKLSTVEEVTEAIEAK
jgi:hypothetical protein